MVALFAALTACGPGGVPAPDVPVPTNPLWTGSTMPDPVPEENVVLSMPKDMYRHDGAPTEWWWHIGTLRAGDRVFGFEINAASFVGQDFAMTQVSLSDVENQRHYERTNVYGPAPIGVFDVATWAEGDPKKDWYAKLGDESWTVGGFTVTSGGSGYTSAPDVKFEGGGGDGASAIAVMDAAGAVSQIVLLKPGSGYTSTPTVTLSGADVIDALENGVSDIENAAGRFPQVAGLKYSNTPAKPATTARPRARSIGSPRIGTAKSAIIKGIRKNTA